MRSKAYRSSLSASNTGNRLAMQIRLLREAAGMSQADLAKKLGTRQSAVARLEDLEYGKHSLAVIHKLAAVFDVAAWVEFVPFSVLLKRTADLSPTAMTPCAYHAEFDEDGEPNSSVRLEFDGSAICKMNYVSAMPTSTGIYINSITHSPV